MPDKNRKRAKHQSPEAEVQHLAETTDLSPNQARELIRTGAVEKGMIPKVEACLDTLDKGIRKIHIVDGRERHGLLLEIYTNTGVGTEIVKESA